MNLLVCITLAAFSQMPAEDDKEGRIAFLKAQAERHSLFLDAEATKPLKLSPTPLLFYTNWSGHSSDGVSFLWLAGERPAAMLSFSIRRPRDDVFRECGSLWATPLECRLADDTVWSPKSGGIVAQPLTDAPAPAAGKAQRLVQMRDLARRFDVTLHRNEEEITPLRALTTPIYRFEAEAQGILDGALFAFVTTNDPEMLLLLEATRDNPIAQAKWRYTLTRMHSARQVVRFDGREIWSPVHYYRDPNEDRFSGAYNEQRIGKYVAPAAK